MPQLDWAQIYLFVLGAFVPGVPESAGGLDGLQASTTFAGGYGVATGTGYAAKSLSEPTPSAGQVTFGAPVGGWGPLSYNPQLGLVYINVTNGGSYRAPGPVPASR